ncbi:hypothetical protein GGX14DRAFT_432025 [Mycena pura]|uniref:F-box domain-containing protein n=1 Tax=Mycena pura TaxID=153505 RepID=A0AAD6VRT2_9AGAR|nr:hypothetical protein GGX14DRAFT_432025 [Mycena pura]
MSPEGLTNVFAVDSPTESVFNETTHFYSTQLEYLANVHLLTLSQVCSQWHSLIIGNPTFWASIFLFAPAWAWAPSGSRLERISQLLKSVLERGGDCPITCTIYNNTAVPPPICIFHLLAQHSHRWSEAHFLCSMEGLDLSILQGRLPLLQTLEIGPNHRLSSQQTDCLDSALVLDTLAISSSCLELPTIALNRLLNFECAVISLEHIPDVISFLPRLKAVTELGITFQLDRWGLRDFTGRIPIQIAPETLYSPATFSCTFDGPCYPACQQALCDIFGSLTLPKLNSLSINAMEYPECIVEWPNYPFFGLIQRSRISSSLKVLKITPVQITESELIDALSAVPGLEHLEVADKIRVRNWGVDLLLITNNLLRALTRTPDSDGLATRLRRFFTHSLFLDFVVSRLEPRSFSIDIRPVVEDDGHLEPALARHKQKLVYVFGPAQFSSQSSAPWDRS